MTQPNLYMVAGPNGTGKTTSAMKLLPNNLSIYEFVNADEIARGLNPLNRDGQAIPAGRLMLERIDDLIKTKKNFAFETTGSSKIFAEKLKHAKAEGYFVGLVYLWLPSADMAKERVRLRTIQGGHNIPVEIIERRYNRGLSNLINLYIPIVDHVVVFDSTMPLTEVPEIIAEKSNNKWHISKTAVWEQIVRTAKEDEHD